jgi:hypothetical protein
MFWLLERLICLLFPDLYIYRSDAAQNLGLILQNVEVFSLQRFHSTVRVRRSVVGPGTYNTRRKVAGSSHDKVDFFSIELILPQHCGPAIDSISNKISTRKLLRE